LSKYYDHNKIWSRRLEFNHPVWGSYSVILYKRILALLDQHGIESGRLIDYGCGAGKFGELAEAAGFNYTGIDDSNAAIELGKKTWPNMELLEWDLAHQDLPPKFQAYADIGTAINSLHCLTEPAHRQQFLKNMALGIKSGGLLFISTMVGPVTKDYRPSENPRLYLDPDLVLKELATVGFTQVLYRADLPANDQNGIPNLEAIVKAVE
jgi:2-polyprenyl-3-methyl-5-hydroxy-6-metoxy-1,4-benzoquinol methylase